MDQDGTPRDRHSLSSEEECSGSEDSEEDCVTIHNTWPPETVNLTQDLAVSPLWLGMDDKCSPVNSFIPIISITSHGTHREYRVPGGANHEEGYCNEPKTLENQDVGLQRSCTSCPALTNQVNPASDSVLVTSPVDTPAILIDDSHLTDSQRICIKTDKSESKRRRSWSDLNRERNENSPGSLKQRSISASSLDSEGEELIINAKPSPDPSRTQSSLKGVTYSTGSLKDDLNLLKERASKTTRAPSQGVLKPRLTLQKSISTPSIFDNDEDTEKIRPPSLLITDSEGDEPNDHFWGTTGLQISPNSEYSIDATDGEEDQSKRRKRGSLFFRKRKFFQDKNSKTLTKQSNQPLQHSSFKVEKVSVYPNRGGSNMSASFKYQSPSSLFSGPSGTLVSCKPPDEKLQSSADNQTSSSEGGSSYDTTDSGLENLEEFNVEPDLKLLEEEPESWRAKVDREITTTMSEVDIKRQEHIYEFIITEKHHCLTLQVMQKLFVERLKKDLGYKNEVMEKLFPCLPQLIKFHMSFLQQLRNRERECSVVGTITDILVNHFSGSSGQQLKQYYGSFCSQHKDAVTVYKDLLKTDRKFQTLVKQWSFHPLLKKKGIPECILFVTQRITKYPLLIDPLIKTSKKVPEERSRLTYALTLVKEILVDVNGQVAEKEKQLRLLDIYNRLDIKSYALYGRSKFKKADLLLEARKLRFEGMATLTQNRNKTPTVMVVVLSDVILFLTENNQKYYFFTPEGKPGIIPLKKVFLREKAGAEQASFYILADFSPHPEMHELVCVNPKDQKTWIASIRDAIDRCPEDSAIDEAYLQELGQFAKPETLDRLRTVTAQLSEKDEVLAETCRSKLILLIELLELYGLSSEDVYEVLPRDVSYANLTSTSPDQQEMKARILGLVQEASQLVSSLYNGGTNLSRSISSVGERQSDTFISPTLPKRAETFGGFDHTAPLNSSSSSPALSVTLPSSIAPASIPTSQLITPSGKLAGANKKKNSPVSSLSQLSPTWLNPSNFMPDLKDYLTVSKPGKDMRRASGPLPSRSSDRPTLPRRGTTYDNIPPSMLQPTPESVESVFTLPEHSSESSPSVNGASSSERLFSPFLAGSTKEQQLVLLNLSHNLNTLLCIVSQYFSSLENVKAQLLEAHDRMKTGSTDRKLTQYRHNHQLEELRNLQDKFSKEKEEWAKEKEWQEDEIKIKKQELAKLQEQMKKDEQDIREQRETLYRKLESLKNQGIILSSNLTVVATHTPSGQPASSPTADFQVTDGVISTTSPTSPTSTSERRRLDLRKQPSAASLKRSDTREGHSNPLPLHLMSTVNQQRGAPNVQVKQQFPMKLAKLASESTAPPTSGAPRTPQTGTSVTHASGEVQQILPLKLSETNNDPKPPNSRSSFYYQKLGSTSSSSQLRDSAANFVTHLRTVSSPAHLPSSSTGTSITYPRPYKPLIPVNQKKWPSSSSHQSEEFSSRSKAEEDSSGQIQKRVRDPETNQEIIFF